MKIALEEQVQPTFFTQKNPSFKRRFLPGYNSIRRIKLQLLGEERLRQLGYCYEQIDNINDEPILDFAALTLDVTTTGLIIAAGIGIYQGINYFLS